MFGWIRESKLKELKEILDKELSTVQETVARLSTELHGTQSSLYSLIDRLKCDLKLDKKGKPVVIKRK
jgi:hypothetical protein